MKNILSIACMLLFSITSNTFGQQISETAIALGISKTSSSEMQQYWDLNTTPTYLTFNVNKNWYNNDHWISLRKEAGLNLQYSYFNVESGGLGASNHLTGNVVSLFANAVLQARLRINNTMAFGIGPEAEILIIGHNRLNNSYQTIMTKPPSAGSVRYEGFNRDYFNPPSFGIKLSLFESMVDARTSIALNFSYLWTQSESSNFYASNYTRISFVIGFKKQKKEIILDEPIKEAK